MASSDRRDRNEDDRPLPAALSRRATVRGVGGGGLAALLAAAGGRVAAQGAATPAAAVPPVVRAWVDAQNGHDPAAHAALYAPNGVLEDVPNRSVVRRPEIEGFVAGVLRGFGEIRVELRHAFGGDGSAVAEYDFSATNLGMIPIPGTEGKRFTSRTATVFELDGDLIRRSSDYYDVGSILAQLGARPGLSAPPAATPAP